MSQLKGVRTSHGATNNDDNDNENDNDNNKRFDWRRQDEEERLSVADKTFERWHGSQSDLAWLS
jgi:hypothetical protein